MGALLTSLPSPPLLFPLPSLPVPLPLLFPGFSCDFVTSCVRFIQLSSKCSNWEGQEDRVCLPLVGPPGADSGTSQESDADKEETGGHPRRCQELGQR